MRKIFAPSFQTKLLGCFIVVALLAMMVPILYTRPVLHEAILQDSLEQLQQEAILISTLLKTEQNKTDLNSLAAALEGTKIRLTIMSPQGTILFESSSPEGGLEENHADRPEMLAAIEFGQGSATRFSTTLQTELLYTALRMENGNILRLALPFAGVKQRVETQLTGLSLAAFMAIALSLLLAWFFAKRIKHSLAEMSHVVQGISLGQYTRRLRRIPGEEFQPLADAVNRMAESIETSILAMTDQKNQLEAVLETMAEAVLVLDPKGHVRRVNTMFTEYFPQAAPEGRQVVEIIPSPALQDAVSAMLTSPDDYGKDEILQITCNNRVFSVLLAKPHQEAADFFGLVAVFRDITELVRLETVRRDFVANVSHELRTPLTAIRGYAETMEDMEGISEHGRCFAEIIRKHSIFLSDMVDELLTLSRLESENFCLDYSSIKAVLPLHRAGQMLQAEMERKHLRLVDQITPDLLVQADARLLERVFRNLLENACRYAPEGSELIVATQVTGTEALFSVSDQGAGIPAADLGRIFERFYQVEKHRGSSRVVGGGLGLAICKHIIERHHGRIWAESPAPNAATTFFFTLPLTTSLANNEDLQ